MQDHSYLIEKALDIINNSEHKFIKQQVGDDKECRRAGFGKGKKNNTSVVLSADTAVELGSPDTESLCIVLWTKKNGLVRKRILTSDTELYSTGTSAVSFLECILLQFDDETDPVDTGINLIKNLTNKIPGLMTRSNREKQWIRIHKDLKKKNFSLYSLAQCLYRAYTESIKGLKGIEIILVADNPALISQLRPVGEAAWIISDENRKLKWLEDGVVECEDLDCEVCENQPTCEMLDEIVEKRKKR